MKKSLVWLLVVAGTLSGVSASAQEEKAEAVEISTLLIQDGQVFINGRPAPLPHTEGVTLEHAANGYFQVTFTGQQPLIFPIGNQWFRFEEDELVPQVEVDALPFRAAPFVAPEMEFRRSQDRAYRSAIELYMNDMQQQNERLFAQLSDEQRMEAQARALASQIRMAPSTERREALRAELRATLGSVLDIKQRNRRAEIRELEQRLGDLKVSLEKREQMREELIESRMRELLGSD